MCAEPRRRETFAPFDGGSLGLSSTEIAAAASLLAEHGLLADAASTTA
jgi:hypothetical protein